MDLKQARWKTYKNRNHCASDVAFVNINQRVNYSEAEKGGLFWSFPQRMNSKSITGNPPDKRHGALPTVSLEHNQELESDDPSINEVGAKFYSGATISWEDTMDNVIWEHSSFADKSNEVSNSASESPSPSALKMLFDFGWTDYDPKSRNPDLWMHWELETYQ